MDSSKSFSNLNNIGKRNKNHSLFFKFYSSKKPKKKHNTFVQSIKLQSYKQKYHLILNKKASFLWAKVLIYRQYARKSDSWHSNERDFSHFDL